VLGVAASGASRDAIVTGVMTGPEVVVALVVVARLLVPLAIPRFPLPAIVAALVLDAADQTLFQAVGAGDDLDAYQSYDKALDVYYLTVAYVATMRNWLDRAALAVARFLFYWRIVGVVAFELTGARALLLVFPNTFEYFFIFYEAVRLRYDPSRLRRAQIVCAAAGIWVLVKLPQEWWIHIAQLDVTDALAERRWLLPVLLALAAALAVLAVALRHRLPKADHGWRLDADAHPSRPDAPVRPRTDARAVFSTAVLEKVTLIAMVAVIFSQVLPAVQATELQLIAAVAFVVAANSAVSFVRLRRGTRWASTLIQFGSMVATNAMSVLVAALLIGREADEAIRPTNTVFFLLLISLIITLYDRYRVIGNEARGRFAPDLGRYGVHGGNP
jgi:hypothetical protein